MKQTEEERLTFEASVETLKVVEHLAQMCVSDTVTYKELDIIAGIDVRESGRLHSARNIIQRESQMVFGVIRGVGLQRLDDSQIVHTADDRRNRIRRAAHRGRKTLSCADFKKLSKEDRIKHTVSSMLLHQLQKMAAAPTIKRATREYKVSPQALEHFKSVS